jgi:hypothetical protein
LTVNATATLPRNAVDKEAESVTGGTEVTSGGYKYHVFTGSSSLVVSGGYKDMECLMIGGGGAGPYGGSGCGQIVNQDFRVVSETATITVGAGANSVWSVSTDGIGGSSIISATNLTIKAVGGGAGSSVADTLDGRQARTGGGGGGGATYRNSAGSARAALRLGANGLTEAVTEYSSDIVPNGTYGFKGGNGHTTTLNTKISAAGGGGASAQGQDNTSDAGSGTGGGAGTGAWDSWLQAISGSVSIGEDSGGVLYIGGGGAGLGYNNGYRDGTGGLGGGGNGRANGDANTGAGAGGGTSVTGGTNGGSGFVIIRYTV